MELSLPPHARLFIIEGIAGAGKNTLHHILKEQLADRLVYDFAEEELLFTWKQAWIPNIDEMRLYFFENLLSYCEQCLQENPDAVFILNRFHISYTIFHSQDTVEKQKRYSKLLERIRKIGAWVYVPLLDESEIEQRSIHSERTNPIWRQHLQKRLTERGYTNLREMYTVEQNTIRELLKTQ